MLKNRIKYFDFFDCQNEIKNCALNTNYWLASSDFNEYVNAKISLMLLNQQLVFFPFKNQKPFYKKKITDLSKLEQIFLISDLAFVTNYEYPLSVTTGNPLEVAISKINQKTCVIIYSLGGQRAPESIVVLDIIEIDGLSFDE
ncbi:hypothetical protein CNR22_12035 [Sphingobacteriaceae bacterium]|nr:hypothetical protein CNR22_12035 [Sphingobacteriaceae bacterium]